MASRVSGFLPANIQLATSFNSWLGVRYRTDRRTDRLIDRRTDRWRPSTLYATTPYDGGGIIIANALHLLHRGALRIPAFYRVLILFSAAFRSFRAESHSSSQSKCCSLARFENDTKLVKADTNNRRIINNSGTATRDYTVAPLRKGAPVTLFGNIILWSAARCATCRLKDHTPCLIKNDPPT